MMDKLNEELKDIILLNSKLGTIVKIFSEFHLTPDEKKYVSQEVNTAISIEKTNEIYEVLKKLFQTNTMFESQIENGFSNGFDKEIISFYQEGKDFDPVKKISDNFNAIEKYFLFVKQYRETGDEDAIKKIEGLQQECIENTKEISGLLSSYSILDV